MVKTSITRDANVALIDYVAQIHMLYFGYIPDLYVCVAPKRYHNTSKKRPISYLGLTFGKRPITLVRKAPGAN